MESSIQELLKKINSRLSFTDCISISLTTLILCGFSLYVYLEKTQRVVPVTYESGESTEVDIDTNNPNDSRPFASFSGKTYTFSWCQGASTILAKNRVYFRDEIQAKESGRTLSLLCKK